MACFLENAQWNWAGLSYYESSSRKSIIVVSVDHNTHIIGLASGWIGISLYIDSGFHGC